MRLEWIDDILAVLDSGSLARAAEKRLLTQSAFTRRVRLIEESIGAALFDRRRKPITLMPGVQGLEPELRDLSAELHKMRRTLKMASDQTGKSLSFVCQHALTTTVSPQVVRILTEEGDTSVRVRSGNQGECLLQLISGQVDFAIMYALPDEPPPSPNNAFDETVLGTDALIPVSTPANRPTAILGDHPTIIYPADVFLGQVFARAIAPQLPEGTTISVVAETALTLAMLQLVLSDIGMAWLPHTLVAADLAQGELIRLDSCFPAQLLTVRLVRLAEPRSEHLDQVWQKLADGINL